MNDFASRLRHRAGLNAAASPAYATGGQVGPGGMPMMGGQAKPMDPQMMQMNAQQMAQSNPQLMAQIQTAVQQAIASGELTPQELQQAIQLAQVAISDPSMWPQIRAFAIRQGIAQEQDLPREYDQGLLFVLLMVAQAAQSQVGGQPQQGQGGPPAYNNGGALPQRSSDPSGVVNINAHEGEYVIPAHVVRAKGTEFFDALLNKYDPNAQE